MPPNSERTDTRVPVTLIVEYEGAGDLVEDYSSNLSVGGTFVHTQRHMPKGTLVQLVLSFPGLLEPIHLSGEVKWSSQGEGGDPNGVGIEFVDHDDEAREKLRSVIEAIQRGDRRLVGRSMQVLLVEDNRYIAKLVQDGLSQASKRAFDRKVAFEFAHCSDTEVALDVLGDASVRFDSIIIDMSIPRSRELIARATVEGSPHANTPVIAVADSQESRDEARGAGCHYLVPKPLRLRELTRVMNQLMRDFEPG